MPQKIPPPVGIAKDDPALNRWLVELTSILNASGIVSIANVTGLEAATLEQEITTINGEILTINNKQATFNTTLAFFLLQNKVFNGPLAPVTLQRDGDWYAQTGAAKHIYVQVAGVWTLIV